MDLKETLAISGHSGLFKFVSQGRNGIVVESFADKKRSFVPATTKVSSLDDIAVYTTEKEIPLKDVFKGIFEKETGGKAIDAKVSSPDELKKYMNEILPDYDRERVYISDIKKMLIWYNILHDNNLLKFEDEEKATGETAVDKQGDKPEAEAADATITNKKPVKAKAKAKSDDKKTEQPAKSKAAKTTKKEKSPVKK